MRRLEAAKGMEKGSEQGDGEEQVRGNILISICHVCDEKGKLFIFSLFIPTLLFITDGKQGRSFPARRNVLVARQVQTAQTTVL